MRVRPNMENKEYRICTNCVMDTSDPLITFDESGRCDFCENYYDSILPNWHTDGYGWEVLQQIAGRIKRNGHGREHDCIIGLSGGTDSSFLTHIAVEKLGLRPLLIAVDTGWNLDVANDNIGKLVSDLHLDLETITVDWDEMKDLQIAFFKSAVPYQDTPQDHAIFAGLYNAAASRGIKYVLTGANNSTECVKPPQEWTYYNDIRMIKDIHRRFGDVPLRTFPLCSMFKSHVWYRYFKGMRVVKPLNYVRYTKEEATAVLGERYGWKRYENKHYENRLTRFIEGWWMPEKFGYDKRRCYHSSLILTGQMTREEALVDLSKPAYDEELVKEDMAFICGKLEITEDELMGWFRLENKTFRDYHNNYGLIKAAIQLAVLVGMEKRNFR